MEVHILSVTPKKHCTAQPVKGHYTDFRFSLNFCTFKMNILSFQCKSVKWSYMKELGLNKCSIYTFYHSMYILASERKRKPTPHIFSPIVTGIMKYHVLKVGGAHFVTQAVSSSHSLPRQEGWAEPRSRPNLTPACFCTAHKLIFYIFSAWKKKYFVTCDINTACYLLARLSGCFLTTAEPSISDRHMACKAPNIYCLRGKKYDCNNLALLL